MVVEVALLSLGGIAARWLQTREQRRSARLGVELALREMVSSTPRRSDHIGSITSPTGSALDDARNSRLIYRTRDGKADYHFSYGQQQNGQFHIYILSQPDYRGRATDAHSTHRYSDSGGFYICWTGDLAKLSDAKEVSARWADLTQRYIETGQCF